MDLLLSVYHKLPEIIIGTFITHYIWLLWTYAAKCLKKALDHEAKRLIRQHAILGHKGRYKRCASCTKAADLQKHYQSLEQPQVVAVVADF